MKRFPSSPTRRSQAAAALAIFISIAGLSASALAQPAAAEAESNVAKNLARMNCGAKIECITPDGRASTVPNASEQTQSAAALIMDDDTLSCPLQEGETTFIISLPNTSMLDRFKFVNENAAARGELKIAVSNYQLPAASSKWVEVDGRIAFTKKRLFNLSMVGVEARYVKLSFNVEKGGRIASLGLYGDETLQRFAQRQHNISWVSQTVATRAISRRPEDRLNFNFANLYAKARVVYVSSGIAPAARRMIDDDTETGFRFAPNDPHPTTIVELAESERLNRVSARYQMAAGRFDVYLLNKLAADPGDLGGLSPVASVTDHEAGGKAAVDFDAQGARYVALRWTPATAGEDQTFEVAEINAFGDMPLAMLTLHEAPDLYARASSAITRPGEISPDISSTLGPIAIPPVLPEVSP